MKLKKLNVPFTQIPNEVLYHPKLSFKAKGLWAYFQSKPEGWDFSSKRIAKESKDGQDSILSGIKELEAHGFLTKAKKPDGKMQYCLILAEADSLNPKTPNRELTKQGNTQTGKSPTISNKELKVIKNISNKEEREAPSKSSGQLWEEMMEPHLSRYAPSLIDKFTDYWRQKNHNGLKEHWEKQQTFDMSRRLATWKKRDDEWRWQKEEQSKSRFREKDERAREYTPPSYSTGFESIGSVIN